MLRLNRKRAPYVLVLHLAVYMTYSGYCSQLFPGMIIVVNSITDRVTELAYSVLVTRSIGIYK